MTFDIVPFKQTKVSSIIISPSPIVQFLKAVLIILTLSMLGGFVVGIAFGQSDATELTKVLDAINTYNKDHPKQPITAINFTTYQMEITPPIALNNNIQEFNTIIGQIETEIKKQSSGNGNDLSMGETQDKNTDNKNSPDACKIAPQNCKAVDRIEPAGTPVVSDGKWSQDEFDSKYGDSMETIEGGENDAD